MKEKAAYLRGLIEGLGIDETTKEGKGIRCKNPTGRNVRIFFNECSSYISI